MHALLFQLVLCRGTASSMMSLCDVSQNGKATPPRCSSRPAESGLWNYVYLFVFAISLTGVGAVPLYILAITYYDDCLQRHTASMYNGEYQLV